MSTEADPGDARHYVEPIPFEGTFDEARALLIRVVEQMPGAAIRSDDGPRIHAEFTSRVFRFVDDVHLFVDRDESRVHVRSASRTGYQDFGANRRRVEELRRRFLNASGSHKR